ncbi:MAG: hypothetical protein GY755_22980 [Chloroflexi bacterium]|nr:hypothetical protein [Chloroflexota bacterium]
MSSWSELSQKNLFPFSKEQSDFEIALQEWAHTGVLVDHLFPVESCQLCEHANLRYHFEIANNETQATLQVGSSCIEKFGIAIYDNEGNKLQGPARGKQLREEINTQKQEMMAETLGELWRQSEKNREEVATYVRAYQERGGFSPKNLLSLFTLMKDEGIDYIPHTYKVTLRRKEDRDYLYRISVEDRELIWGSLSTAQKKGYLKRKKDFDKSLERKKTLYSSPTHLSSITETQQEDSLPDWPIRYSERAHRYKITFFDEKGKPLKRLFRGDLEESRSFIREQIANNPEFEKAEIRFTETNDLVEIL